MYFITGGPGKPLSPENPWSPDGPGSPTLPGGPTGPSAPSLPLSPGWPGTPAWPGKPDTPGSPIGPGSPDGPCGPIVPGKPVVPILPGSPWTYIQCSRMNSVQNLILHYFSCTKYNYICNHCMKKKIPYEHCIRHGRISAIFIYLPCSRNLNSRT